CWSGLDVKKFGLSSHASKFSLITSPTGPGVVVSLVSPSSGPPSAEIPEPPSSLSSHPARRTEKPKTGARSARKHAPEFMGVAYLRGRQIGTQNFRPVCQRPCLAEARSAVFAGEQRSRPS